MKFQISVHVLFFTVMFVLGTAAHLKQSCACFTITEPFWQAQRNGLLPCIVSHLSKVKWSDPCTELSLRKKGQCVLMDLGRMQSETCFHCLRQHQKEARWFMLLVYCQVAFAEAWLPRFSLKKPSPEDRPFLLDPHVLFLQLWYLSSDYLFFCNRLTMKNHVPVTANTEVKASLSWD